MAFMELRSVQPEAYSALAPLIPEEPATHDARALLLAERVGITVRVDSDTAPTAVVVEQETAGKHVVTVAGEFDAPVLAAHIRTLARPMTLRAPAALAARLPDLCTGLVARAYVSFMPPLGRDAAFTALPPGGVRRLRPADARGLTAIPDDAWGTYATATAALREGMAYARYLRAEIVSLACVTARTEHYASVAAFTIERARRNGFARECLGRLVGALVAEWDVAPLLTSAADDDAARGLAHALGFTEEDAWKAYILK